MQTMVEPAYGFFYYQQNVKILFVTYLHHILYRLLPIKEWLILGGLRFDARAELIEGEIIDKALIGSSHVSFVH